MPDGIDDLRAKYEEKIKRGLAGEGFEGEPLVSSDYTHFKRDNMPGHMGFYEKMCNFSEKLLKIPADQKQRPELEEAIKVCHLQVTPDGITSLSVVGPILLSLIAVVVTYLIPSLLFGTANLFFVILSLFVGLIMIIPLQNLPIMMANNWRMRASNQMVLCIFYVVTYMRHTSNLERALSFAAEHLGPPLSLDLKKVIWDVESERFESIKESLDDYLQGWRKYNMEFIESMHLIESSLFETSESRKLDALEKSLDVMLSETYEKMLHYAHNLKGPLTALHMLGIILPILGLVILPLLVSFMPEVKWYHLAVLYNLLLPIGVYYLAKNILTTRPTGYGEVDLSESVDLSRYKNVIVKFGKSETLISPFALSFFVFVLFFIIGIAPLLLHAANPNWDIVISEGELRVISSNVDPQATFYLLGYRKEIIQGQITDTVVGPFGLGAMIMSILLVVGVAIGFGMYLSLKTKNLIKIRNKSRALEQEFASALFQLGNRLGDGVPAEIAFGKVAQVMEGTLSGKFFELVSINISKLGMSVEQAVFDKKRGALLYYPSNLIESSMKVLIESSKKGPLIASQALINVAEYIKQIHRVDERLKDLMADIVSDMRSQVRFLTPAIAGIVVGITSMITQIIGSLSLRLGELAGQASEQGNIGAGANLLGLFGTGISTYFFQLIVGLYVVQITYILSTLLNGIENGSDRLNEKYLAGTNMIKTGLTYAFITLVISIMFNIVASSILSSFTVS